MAVNALSIWQSTLAALAKTEDASWATNFAAWYADQIAGIEPDPSTLTPAGWSFTFAQPLFVTELTALAPTDDATTGISGFADAWETAILATAASCSAGTTYGGATFGSVSSTVIDPPSIVAGKAKIMELVAAATVADALDSEFPAKFRDATLLLTITVTGTDSSSGAPLVAPEVPLV